MERQILFLFEDKINAGPEDFRGRQECFTPDKNLKDDIYRLVSYGLKAFSFRTLWLKQQRSVGLTQLKSIQFLDAFDTTSTSSFEKEFILDVMQRRNVKLDRAIETLGLDAVLRFETEKPKSGADPWYESRHICCGGLRSWF